MPSKKQILKDSRMAIIQAKKDGLTNRAVASLFNIDQRTVGRIYARFKKTNDVNRKPGSGRPKKLSIKEERIIARIVKCDPIKTAIDAKRYAFYHLDRSISKWTAQRILKRAKLFARRPAKKPLISKKNQRSRVAFAKRHKDWTANDWAKVLWSDESKFNLFSSDGIRWVRRPKRQRFQIKYQVPTVKHGGGSVLVWGMYN